MRPQYRESPTYSAVISHGRSTAFYAVQPGSDSLSGRELQVLRSVAEGLSNKEIASDLDISVHTVARHVTNIMRKLSAANRAQAAATALRRGMLAF